MKTKAVIDGSATLRINADSTQIDLSCLARQSDDKCHYNDDICFYNNTECGFINYNCNTHGGSDGKFNEIKIEMESVPNRIDSFLICVSCMPESYEFEEKYKIHLSVNDSTILETRGALNRICHGREVIELHRMIDGWKAQVISVDHIHGLRSIVAKYGFQPK